MAYLSPVQFADTNIAGTTLVGTILAGDNTLTLTSAAVLGSPSSPSFDILIDNEYITVNGVSGNVCTPLSRGANGSTPAGHTAGAAVYAPITVGMINAAMARIDQANAAGFQSPSLTPSGLYAAVQSVSRVVGAVAPGVGTAWTPAGGPYAVGDIVWDVSNASFYVCSVLGSPGTWIAAPSLKLAQTYSLAATMLFLNRTDAAALMSHVAVQRGGSTKYRFGLDASDQFALLDSTGASINLGVTDAGIGTLRNALNIPPSAGGALAATSYGTVPVKFAETVLGTTAASISFTSIPSGFRHFKADYFARGDFSGTNITTFLRVNNDSAANYDCQDTFTSTATALTTEENIATASPRLAYICASTAPANLFGVGRVEFKHYAGTTGNKAWVWQAMWTDGTTTGLVSRFMQGGGKWRTTATAINRVDFFPVTGNYIAGTLFSIQMEP